MNNMLCGLWKYYHVWLNGDPYIFVRKLNLQEASEEDNTICYFDEIIALTLME